MKNIFAILFLLQFVSCQPNKPLDTIDSFETAKIIAHKNDTKMFVVFDLFGASTNYVDKILSNQKIKKTLDNYVVVRLMCDDRRKMNDTLTIGDFNVNIQRKITEEFYQPMFYFLDAEGRRLSPPLGYSKADEVLKYTQKYGR